MNLNRFEKSAMEFKRIGGKYSKGKYFSEYSKCLNNWQNLSHLQNMQNKICRQNVRKSLLNVDEGIFLKVNKMSRIPTFFFVDDCGTLIGTI